MASEQPMSAPRRVRVAVVDDNEDVRLLLRVQLELDPRFEVVGEAADGVEAIQLAEELQPDLMVLDRHMPRLGGVEAIPEIRQHSPQTAVVLYTAGTDTGTYQAALAAGALEVVEKRAGRQFVEGLTEVLLNRQSGPEATVEVRVGPIAAEAARVWVANTKKILDAVAAHPEVIGGAVPDDVMDLFCSFLEQWGELAADADEFHWAARASPADVNRIVEEWARVDRMTDEQLEQLGIHWSPPEGEPFFQALIAGVLAALRRHAETGRLAALLGEQWAPYLPEKR